MSDTNEDGRGEASHLDGLTGFVYVESWVWDEATTDELLRVLATIAEELKVRADPTLQDPSGQEDDDG